MGQDSDKLESGSLSNPRAFGKYYLLGLIARGGMAEVYRARPIDPDDARLLAIKVMRPQLAVEARFVDMFNREGKLAMMLDSRAIVKTLEIGLIGEQHYIAMEYISGRDMNHVLRRCQEQSQRIPVPHAVHIAARIAEGLDVAHRLTEPDGRPLNLVNRDVSPSNVRISYEGDVKLLDFGIAQALMSFTSEIGVLKGKFSYMSPEQIRGMPLDARSDIFSLGIILHELLTMRKLFRGESEFALMEKVRSAQVEPPSAVNKRVSPELDRVVMRALARDLNDRYQSAGELRADLEQVVASYHFERRELEDFVRRLFRPEWLREQEHAALALRSLPGAPGAEAAVRWSELATPTPTLETRTDTGGPADQVVEDADTEPADVEPRAGFWERLRRWRR